MLGILNKIFDLVFVLLSTILVEIVTGIFFWVPSIRKQTKHRNFWSLYQQLNILKKSNHSGKPIVIFHCSSAGEFEQARSVFELFSRYNHDYFYVFLLHSISGIKYIDAKKISVNVVLSPIDSLWRWAFFFYSLKPTMIIYTRYEVWPSLLASAAFFGSQQHLMMASSKDFKSCMARLYFKWCTKYLKSCSLVDPLDLKVFKKYSSSTRLFQVLGDTKYDNVIERSKADVAFKAEKSISGSKHYSESDKFKLVCGSVWDSDLIWLLDAFTLIPESIMQKLDIRVVPHDITEGNVRLFRSLLSGYTFNTLKLELIPKMGILFEFYAQADACFVGGSIQGKVHNVLEPLVFRKPTIIGNSYSNSLEAINAVEAGLIKLVVEKKDLSEFLEACMAKGRENFEFKERVDRFFSQKSGSAERIFKFLNSFLKF